MNATQGAQRQATGRSRARNLRSAGLAALMLGLALPVAALAFSSYFSSWTAVYPTSLSGTNASCNLCHGGNTGTWNAYGQAIRDELARNGGDITAAIKTVQALNSDKDPGGKTNLAEIQAGSQPGWTVGSANTIYDGNGTPTTGHAAPAGIGLLDPPADTTKPTATLKAPASPTKATTLTYALTFSESVTGLAAADFTRTGTATGCVVGAPTGSGASYAIPVTSCSAGTVILTLKAGSVLDLAANAGPVSASIAATVTIDRTAPTATTPVASLRTGASLSGSTIPVTVAWTGADTGGAGVARYDLARSTDNGVTWAAPVSVATASKATTVTGSGTVRFRVRAIDKAGNIGAWIAGPNLTPSIVQTATSTTGTWLTQTATTFSGGSTRYASAANASATFTFTGRSIALVTTVAASRGAVKIYVDGSATAIVLDTYAATTAYQRLAWTKTWSTSASHTIKLVVVGTAGRPRVDLDAFAILK